MAGKCGTEKVQFFITAAKTLRELKLSVRDRQCRIMQTYTCGFLFSPDRSRLLLIRKNRIAQQTGEFNGMGNRWGNR